MARRAQYEDRVEKHPHLWALRLDNLYFEWLVLHDFSKNKLRFSRFFIQCLLQLIVHSLAILVFNPTPNCKAI
ncbi:hypothetical protein HNQ88_001846 [Aureibacter tunicatorum]|uniref:Uncharacterized protein n=1 Tax=Aureibacter tunicatorum TaxID=866807 RepID=A0AAE4BQ76_9BACT|nr:hypothetical protein [Aureibacter tunicatorum]BDD05264.1 hypothetical protein AUTU_27470 [Aureibacter tunicatorum]